MLINSFRYNNYTTETRPNEEIFCIFVFLALPLLGLNMFGQANTGELRLKVTDPAGFGVKTTVQIVSKANQYRNNLVYDGSGHTGCTAAAVRHL